LYGNLLFLDLVLLPNAFTVLGELVFVLLLWPMQDQRARGLSIAAGLVLGLLTLVRSELLLVVPLLVGVTVLWRNVLPAKKLAWLILGLAVVVVPVAVHNTRTGGGLILVSYNGGVNLYLGNNPKADGTWRAVSPLVRTGSITLEGIRRNSLLSEGRPMKPASSSAHWTREAITFVRQQPKKFCALTLRRIGLFAGNFEIPNNYYFDQAREASLVLRLLALPFGVILALGLGGVFYFSATWKRGYPALLLILVYALTSILTFTLSRLRAPVVPLLLPYAAASGVGLTRWLGARHRTDIVRISPRLGLVALLALVVFVVSLIPLADRRAYAVEGDIQAGNILLNSGQTEAARVWFERARALNPSSVQATYGLFNVAAKLKNRSAAQARSAELYQLSRSAGDSAYALLSSALIGTMSGDFLSARQAYTSVLEIDPFNVDARFLLAMVHHTLGDTSAARLELERTLTLAPDYEDARRWYRQLSRVK
ncbi:MAG: tetratricopeptide repeat protein, partial [candidate division WOR-3 bacterium]